MKSFLLCMSVIGAFVPGFQSVQATPASNVVSAIETTGMQLLYAVNDDQFDFNDPYLIDNSSSIAPNSFPRVAYFIELGPVGNTQWVWVSLNTFKPDPTLVGVPRAGTGIVENGTRVSNLNIESNHPEVTPGRGLEGIIEFWASDYGPGGGGLFGSDDGLFDWKDSGGTTGGGHGSFQVFAFTNPGLTAAKTLFSITAGSGGGIGDQPTGHPDWTFGPGTGTYQIRNLEIWVGDNLNGLPVINDLDGDLLSYTPGTPAVLLDDVTTVASADDPAPVGPMGFDGGSLSVAITLGGDPADDVLGIAHEGTAAGQIGFASPPNVTFGGTVIGTAAGAPFSSGLVVDFNSSATLPGVSALLGKITYVNNNASTTPTARRIEFVLTDGDAAASPPATVTLQMNVGGSLVSHIWEGDVSDAFNTAGNWNTGVVPDANDTAIFRNQGGGSVDLGGSAFVGMVSFDGTGGFDLQNGTLGINAIQHSGTGNNTISADVFSTGFSGMVSDGVITLTSFANTILGSWNITGGNLSAIVQDAATALDDAEVVLDGGTLEFLPGAVSEVNGLLGQVFLGDSGGDLVIDRIGDGTGSGGLLGKAVTGTITVDGEEVIRYDDDAQFRNGRNNPLAQGFESVGLNQSDLYQVMFSGFITIPDLLGGNAPYDVEFGTARADDPVQIYVDLNGNNLFEASPVDNPPDSGGTPQGERVMSRNCCGDQYTISQVTPGRYRFAIAHSEGFGGSNMEPTIDLIPDAHGRRTIAPGSTDPANRPGLFTIQAFARGNNANSVTVLSPSFIVLGSGLPGETLGHLDLRSDLTVVSIDLGQHLEFSSVTLVSGAFSQMGMANLTLRNVSGSGDLIQNGDGIVFLPTLNTYTGTSLVQAGIVDVSANSGLGDVSQGAVVTDGASLRLSGGVLYNALESLTIEGLGNATSDAALLGLSGNVDWSGPISVIGANTRIRSSQARFRIFGQLNNQAGELEMRSDGTLEIQNGGITGAGDIRQTGGNRVIMFQNADAGTDFTGLLTITEGIWDARGDQSLGDPVAGTVVTDGGRLELHDGRTLGDNITISGTDFNAGAIRNENGTNTLAGSVTLATNALIHVNDISLRIEGGVIGGHDLIKTGPGALDLVLDSSIDTFTLNGGAVYIHTLGGLGDTEVLDVDNGQTLGFDGTLLFAGTTLGLLNMNGGTLASASGETTLDIPINLHYFRPIHFAGDGDLVIPGDIGNGDAPLLPDALDHFGFHINDDNLAMNLDLNGGMFNAGNPAGFTNFYGRTLLIRGPGARGLDFDEDQDWVNTGAINQFDNYSDLIVGHLNVAPGQEGTWDFRMVAVDDPGGIWVDLDQDGTFESSVAGLGSDRGEQLQFGGDGGNKQVSLPNSGKYLVAFTHREGGGGSQLQVEFKSPSMGAPATIKPGDPAQAGLWTPLDIVQPDNGLTKSGDGAVTLLGDNRFNGAATITGGTLFAAHENALGSPSAGTSVNGGTVALSFPGLHTIDEAFAIDGTGANGQLGALVSLLGDHTISSAITLTGGIAGMGAADGARLTLADDLDLDGGRVLFDGAGEVIVNGTVFGSLLPGVIPVLGGITAELELWLDASDVDGNFVADSLTDGSAVSSWIDKSGKQRDFNDLIGDPSYVLSSTHGGPAIAFDGDDALRSNDLNGNPRSFIDGNGEFTLISVARYAGAARGRLIATKYGHNWLFGFHGGSSNRGGHYDGWGSQDAQPVGYSADEAWHLHANRMNVLSDVVNPFGAWYRDGLALTQQGDGRGTGDGFFNNVPDGLSLGAWNGLNEPSQGEVSELIMYNRVLTETELRTVEAYLADKYGLSGAFATISFSNDVIKQGTGSVTLAGNNTYQGETSIMNGVLVAASNNALGDTLAGTFVTGDASLALTGGVIIPAGEALTLAEFSMPGSEGLINLDGENRFLGDITSVGGGGMVGFRSDAGTLIVDGTTTLNTSNLAIGGDGDVRLPGTIIGDGIDLQNYGTVLQATPGLHAYYPLDEFVGAMVASNLSMAGAALDGTYLNGATNRQGATSAYPGLGTALDLDNGPSEVTLRTASEMGIQNSSFTAMAWIHPRDLTGDHAVFGTLETGNNLGLHLTTRGTKIHMGFFANDLGGIQDLTVDTWYHVAWRYDSALSEQAIYIDGVRDNLGGGHVPFAGNDIVRIGTWGGGNFFDGIIDEPAVFNRALTDQEIADLFAAGPRNVNLIVDSVLTKAGSGIAIIEADQAFSGGALVAGGLLQVNNPGPGSGTGPGQVIAEEGGTLGGGGIVAGDTLISTRGIVNPGTGPGTLTFGGELVFTNFSSVYRAELNGPGASDALAVTTDLYLNGATLDLRLEPGYTPVAGQMIVIATAAGITGTFNGLPQGSSVSAQGSEFTISYTGNQVLLTAGGTSYIYAGPDTITRSPLAGATVPAAELLLNDLPGGGVSLVSVSDALNGTVSFANNEVTYTPDPGHIGDDSFTYVATDGANLAIGLVTVRASDFATGATPVANVQGLRRLGNGDYRVAFTGTPGAAYDIEWTQDIVTMPVDWQVLGTVIAEVDGSIILDHENPPGDVVYYRAAVR